MKTLLTLIAATLALSCSDSSVDKCVGDTPHQSLHWTPAMLEGHTLELLNDSDTLRMSFNNKDHVIAVDYKSEEDFASGYAWMWKISNEGHLNILQNSTLQMVDSYKLTNYSDSLLVVQSYGTKMTFKRYRTET